jgi:hypothetical protein
VPGEIGNGGSRGRRGRAKEDGRRKNGEKVAPKLKYEMGPIYELIVTWERCGQVASRRRRSNYSKPANAVHSNEKLASCTRLYIFQINEELKHKHKIIVIIISDKI